MAPILWLLMAMMTTLFLILTVPYFTWVKPIMKNSLLEPLSRPIMKTWKW